MKANASVKLCTHHPRGTKTETRPERAVPAGVELPNPPSAGEQKWDFTRHQNPLNTGSCMKVHVRLLLPLTLSQGTAPTPSQDCETLIKELSRCLIHV